MTTGSLVVLLEGGPPASLGTASPTSCNEGSRYIATGGAEGEKRVNEKMKEIYEYMCVLMYSVTFYRFRQEVCSWFGLFDPVALHGLSLFIEAQKPGPARLLLSVEHRAVDHIVVLEH